MNAPIPDDSMPAETPVEPQFEAETNTQFGAFLPLTLLAGSFAVFLLWQVNMLNRQCDTLNQTLEQNKPAVVEAQQAQAGIAKLLNDLVVVAKEDNDAKLLLYYNNVRDASGKPLVTVTNPPPGAAPATSGSK